MPEPRQPQSQRWTTFADFATLKDYMSQKPPPGHSDDGLGPDDDTDDYRLETAREEIEQLKVELGKDSCIVCGDKAVAFDTMHIDYDVEIQLDFCTAHSMTFDRWARNLLTLAQQHEQMGNRLRLIK